MKLDDLSDFCLVATHGGFALAGRMSGRPKASLSRKVMDLEASLGVRLFERGSRSVHLTEEGELLFKSTAGPLHEIAEALDVLRDGRAKPQGRLRVNVPSLFGLMLMGRLAAQFKAAYPDVALEVTMEDREVDLVNEGYDLVIRANPKPDSELVGSCFLREPLFVVAAPSLTDQQPVPVVVRDSARNNAIWQIGGSPGRDIETKPVLALPAFTMIRDAVLTGIGAAKLPRMLVAEDLVAGRLVSWGPIAGQPAEIWALHTSRRFASVKVKAFMQFLKTAFPDE
jgi:DNA-binding transcriptional LysR family regulator